MTRRSVTPPCGVPHWTGHCQCLPAASPVTRSIIFLYLSRKRGNAHKKFVRCKAVYALPCLEPRLCTLTGPGATYCRVHCDCPHKPEVTRQTKRGHSTLTEDDRATAHNHKLNAEKPCGLSQQPTATRTPHTRRDRPGQPLERPTDARRNTRRTRDASSVQPFHCSTQPPKAKLAGASLDRRHEDGRTPQLTPGQSLSGRRGALGRGRTRAGNSRA